MQSTPSPNKPFSTPRRGGIAGLVAKSSKPFVGIPLSKPPPSLGTFGTPNKVWEKAGTQRLAKTQRRKKDLKGIRWLKMRYHTLQELNICL